MSRFRGVAGGGPGYGEGGRGDGGGERAGWGVGETEEVPRGGAGGSGAQGKGRGGLGASRPNPGAQGPGGACTFPVASAVQTRFVFLGLPFSHARLPFFPLQSAIKGKLQELGAYVGKLCCSC